MTIIRNFDFNTKQITAMDVDTSDNGYLWLGFAQNSNNICKLLKVSAHKPTQKYYEIDLSVTEIKDIHVFGSYVYVAINDSTYLFKRYSLSSPLSSSSSISLPSGANEAPIDIEDDGTYIYVLLPGLISGENAKLYKYTSSGTLLDTIDLLTVTNAQSMAIDSNDDIWIITYESPSTLVRVYETSGGSYTYTTTTLGS